MIKNYIEVLKPRESSLLTFIGMCAAFIASDGVLSLELLLIAVTILVASAGANGLTNYLDRDLDARMKRTRKRALPSRRIYPPEKVLPLLLGLVIVGLVLAFVLHWLVFLADLVGTVSAVVWRKRWTCVFPQGMIASCAPVLMGWFAIRPDPSWEILLLCLLIGVWLPLHVWSVMIANREDYIGAGLKYFPISWKAKDGAKLLLIFAFILLGISIALYFAGGFTQLYLVLVSVLGAAMVYASARLVITGISLEAWRVYRLSSFPYLGTVFLVMSLDIWLLR